jgi:hypothetical protein
MKKAISVLFLLFIVYKIQAQSQLILGACRQQLLDYQKERFNPSLGFQGEFRYILKKNFGFGGSIGYDNSDAEVSPEIGVNLQYFTLSGFYYFRKEGVVPIAGLHTGLYGYKYTNNYAGLGIEGERKLKPGISPFVGAQYMFSDMVGVDLSANFLYVMPPESELDPVLSWGLKLGLVLQFGVY